MELAPSWSRRRERKRDLGGPRPGAGSSSWRARLGFVASPGTMTRRRIAVPWWVREGRYRYPLPRLARARAKVGSRKTKSRSVGREPGERRFFALWEPGPGTVNENQTRESGSGGLGRPNLAHIKHALCLPLIFFQIFFERTAQDSVYFTD
jgi:hypothetical protein